MSRISERDHSPISEIITAPIVSFENGDIIAALVLGFETSVLVPPVAEEGLRRGVWLGGMLHMTAVPEAQRKALSEAIRQGTGPDGFPENGMRRDLAGEPHLIFVKQLNPASAYPPAYDVIAYPLAALAAKKSRVRWQVIGIGCLVLGAGLALSHALSRRLTLPVERLVDDSDMNRLQREKAEAALQSTHAELQRAARFSADASHQLKTPVAVLRAGLEQLRSNGEISPDTADEIGALIHQTYRLSSVIEDLLLLSRMDAGRLELSFRPVDVSRILDAALDDFSAQPDVDRMTVSARYPPSLMVSGDQKYIALIVGNLIDNARKYNRPDGRIDISAREQDGTTRILIGNNGHTIDGEGQRHIFERFHRASMGENVPGYGLGLNLARELARLHHGDLLLLRSKDDWTEFEVCFQTAHAPRPSPCEA
jgi:signal transduction histidine kinase